MSQPELLPAGRELTSWLCRRGRPDRAGRSILWLYRWRSLGLEFGYSAMQRKSEASQQFPYPEGEGLVFIQGFWRSGTTLLHELLAELPGCAAPRTWQCMNPSAVLAPSMRPRESQAVKRPMDEVMVSSFSPQEDEFALMVMGVPSVYRGFLDPRNLRELLRYTDQAYWMNEDPNWVKTLEAFLAWCQEPGRDRLIVKSPGHIFRTDSLAAHFPKARFVWILRDPVQLWRSNLKMWGMMIERYGLWQAKKGELEDFIEAALESYAQLIEDLHGRGRFRDQPACSYEALTSQPAATLPELVDRLGLGPWSALDANLQASLLSQPKPSAASSSIPADAPETVLFRIRAVHEAILSAL